MRVAVRAEQAPAPAGPYSIAIVATPFLFIASQGPLNPTTGQVVGSDAAAQARQVFANIGAICAAAGASLDDVVRIQLYVADFDDLEEINAVYSETFTAPFPARTTVRVGLPGFLVAAEATAELPRQADSSASGAR